MAISAVKGGNVSIKVGLSGQPKTELGGQARGLDSWALSVVEDVGEVPGPGPQVHSQKLGYREATATLSVADNQVTRPVFMGKGGRLFEFTVSVDGDDAGKPKVDFEAWVGVAHSFPARGQSGFTISPQVNGLPVEGVN